MKQRGFTLIELIISMTIFAIIGGIFTNFLIQTLRGENKVRTINQAKQNGQTVLDYLSYKIRNSTAVVCIGKNSASSSTLNDTIVIRTGTQYSRYRLYQPNPTSTIPNGYITEDVFTVNQGSVIGACANSAKSIAGVNYQLIPNIPGLTPTPTPVTPVGYVYLTDTDPVNGISVDYIPGKPVFVETSSPGVKSVVSIQFSVFSGVKSGQGYDTSIGSGYIFGTAVQLQGGAR